MKFHGILGKALIGLSVFTLAVVLGTTVPVLAKDADGDIVIVLDAGHGGSDPGAVSAHNGVKEDPTNYRIAMALKAELETYEGVKVYLTRGSAEYMTNSGRGLTGENLNADVTISCHNNSNSNTDPHGVECYITVKPEFKATMGDLAGRITEMVSKCGLTNRGYYGKAFNSEEPNRDYYTLIDESARKAGIPALIIEHAFLSNASDAAFIADQTNQLRVGAADATAIAQYYGLKRRTVNAGESVTLTRTYSAMMKTTVKGSFSSSDESVAHVRADGLITAVGKGTATISCTGDDGAVETVEVTVPKVSIKALSAGVFPTFYANEGALLNYDRSHVLVKAIYSDGSVKQVSNYTLGDVQTVGNNSYYIPISYKDFSCKAHIYVDDYLSTVKATGNNTLNGSNCDILLFPSVYEGINDSDYEGGGSAIEIPTTTEATTAVPVTTEATTEAPTTEATTTEAPTTEAPTTEAPTTEATTPVTTTIEETTSEDTTAEVTSTEETTPNETTGIEVTTAEKTSHETTTASGEASNGKMDTMTILIIVLSAVAVACIVVIVVLLKKTKAK